MIPTTVPRACITGLLVCGVLVTAGCGASGSGGGAGEPIPAAPTLFTYRPFDVTYRIASHTHQEQEFSGQVNTTEYAMHWNLSAKNDPPMLTFTIDSVPTITGVNPGVSTSDLEGAAGAVFTGTFSPEGHIADFTGGDDSNAFLQQLTQSLERFLPRVPAGGAAPGQAWTDTLESTTNSGGLEIKVELITQAQAASWVEHEGGIRALQVTTVTNYSLGGGGTQMGAEIDVAGTGTRHGTLYLGEDGRFLGGFSADTSNMTATVAAMGAIIPIFQTRHDTVAVAR